jgi:hypothetical protein
MGHLMMKGITNAQLREKLEHIESDLQQLKQSKRTESTLPLFLGFFTVFSIISTVMMVLDSHPFFLFFTIIGISEMIFIIVFMIYHRKDN